MIRRRYRCPECSGIFVYDHHPSIEADPLPAGATCPHCGFVPESEYPAAVVAPHIGKPIRATVDNLNRDMENGAAFRAQVAQEQFGLSPEDARAMTETNSRDYLREGDTSAIPVNNEVTRAIDANPQAYGWSGGNAQGAALSTHVQGGPYPNAGLRTMQQIRNVHPAIVASTGHRAVATSSLPALETQQPGYRTRI
jgi:DNA-directed RNA polymerase subunit RPC12/RpoP